VVVGEIVTAGGGITVALFLAKLVLDLLGIEAGDRLPKIIEQFEHGERRTSKATPRPARASIGWG
jgi:hypothetical protein